MYILRLEIVSQYHHEHDDDYNDEEIRGPTEESPGGDGNH